MCFSKVKFPFCIVNDSSQPKFHDSKLSQAELGIFVPKADETHSSLSRGGHPPEENSSGFLKKTAKEKTSWSRKKSIIF